MYLLQLNVSSQNLNLEPKPTAIVLEGQSYGK